jgi:hypothetical protein
MGVNDVGTGVPYPYGWVRSFNASKERGCNVEQDDLHSPRFERVVHQLRCPIAHISAFTSHDRLAASFVYYTLAADVPGRIPLSQLDQWSQDEAVVLAPDAPLSALSSSSSASSSQPQTSAAVKEPPSPPLDGVRVVRTQRARTVKATWARKKANVSSSAADDTSSSAAAAAPLRSSPRDILARQSVALRRGGSAPRNNNRERQQRGGAGAHDSSSSSSSHRTSSVLGSFRAATARSNTSLLRQIKETGMAGASASRNGGGSASRGGRRLLGEVTALDGWPREQLLMQQLPSKLCLPDIKDHSSLLRDTCVSSMLLLLPPPPLPPLPLFSLTAAAQGEVGRLEKEY